MDAQADTTAEQTGGEERADDDQAAAAEMNDVDAQALTAPQQQQPASQRPQSSAAQRSNPYRSVADAIRQMRRRLRTIDAEVSRVVKFPLVLELTCPARPRAKMFLPSLLTPTRSRLCGRTRRPIAIRRRWCATEHISCQVLRVCNWSVRLLGCGGRDPAGARAGGHRCGREGG
jgi:hypothetical protein